MRIANFWLHTISIPGTDLSRNGIQNPHTFHRIASSYSGTSSDSTAPKILSQVQKPEITKLSVSNIHCDRLQYRANEALLEGDRVEFGQFITSEAKLDQEYWTSAWLRAETHWEDQKNDKYFDNLKRKFAEQEFNSMKSRYKSHTREKCTCIVTVKKEDNDWKSTTLTSVVGTLDLRIGYLSDRQTFPGERVKGPLFCLTDRTASIRYGYVANLCVAKSERRKGIARNMMEFAIKHANENDAAQVFVHVHRNNRPAQDMYKNMGFKVVDAATSQLSSDRTYLLCFETLNEY